MRFVSFLSSLSGLSPSASPSSSLAWMKILLALLSLSWTPTPTLATNHLPSSIDASRANEFFQIGGAGAGAGGDNGGGHSQSHGPANPSVTDPHPGGGGPHPHEPHFHQPSDSGVERAPGAKNHVARNCHRLPSQRLSQFNGKVYYFSWLDRSDAGRQVNWNAARSLCKGFCLDLAAVDSREEQDFIARNVVQGDIYGAWIGGHLCVTGNCTSNPKFFPLDGANSWFWSSTGRQLVDSPFSAWSKSGGVRTAQPDNLVNRYGGPVEACLAVLNDWYGDGVAWHDMVCADSLPVICEQP